MRNDVIVVPTSLRKTHCTSILTHSQIQRARTSIISKFFSFILAGDFNARTGVERDFLVDKNSKSPPADDLPIPDDASQTKKFDRLVNDHGTFLLEMCKSLDLRISNGRCKGDTFGQITFHGNQGISTVDYVIVSHDVLQHSQNLIVHHPSPFSDHSQIICQIKIRATNAFKRNNESTVDVFDLPRQLIQVGSRLKRKIFSRPANHRANKINIRL